MDDWTTRRRGGNGAAVDDFSEREETPPFRIRSRDLVSWSISLVGSLVVALSAWFNMSARVDMHTRQFSEVEHSIVRLETEKQSKEAAAGDQREIIARLEALRQATNDLREQVRAKQPSRRY